MPLAERAPKGIDPGHLATFVRSLRNAGGTGTWIMAENSLLRMAKRLAEPLRPRLRPGVLIIGAQKAGTSALFEMLVRHPKVLAPVRKELDFFNDDRAYGLGLKHYLGQFPVAPLRGSGYTSLDATPGYLSHPRCAERIRAAFPDILLVAVLRDPVRRAFSDWNMFRQFKDHPLYAHLHDTRSFEQAVEDELDGRSTGIAYLRRGYYAEQLERYFRAFGRDGVLIVPYPSFRRDPLPVLEAILKRLDLDPSLLPARARTLQANVRPYERLLDPGLAARLSAHFEPRLQALEALLGSPIDLVEDESD